MQGILPASSWTPSRLIIAIVIIREATQIGAVRPDNVDLATVDVLRMIKVGCEGDPLPVGGETWALAVATRGRDPVEIGAICLHNIELAVPRIAGVGHDQILDRPVTTPAECRQVSDLVETASVH